MPRPRVREEGKGTGRETDGAQGILAIRREPVPPDARTAAAASPIPGISSKTLRGKWLVSPRRLRLRDGPCADDIYQSYHIIMPTGSLL